MKRALIFSDTHGRLDNLLDVLKQYPEAEAVFHLGDIEGEAERLRRATAYPVYIVRGNCDYSSDLPMQIVMEYSGKKIGMCHGHRYLNYGGVETLKYWVMEQQLDIAIFGHTHVPYLEQEDGRILLNPGSISRPRQDGFIPTYAVMDIEDNGEVHIDMCQYVKSKKK